MILAFLQLLQSIYTYNVDLFIITQKLKVMITTSQCLVNNKHNKKKIINIISKLKQRGIFQSQAIRTNAYKLPISVAHSYFIHRPSVGIVSHVFCQHIEAQTKWPPFRRWHFQRIFLDENVKILINISLKLAPKGQINNLPALVQLMAWHRPSDKPLSEPMVAGFTDAYMHHSASMSKEYGNLGLEYIFVG